jgi:hypothetical protein
MSAGESLGCSRHHHLGASRSLLTIITVLSRNPIPPSLKSMADLPNVAHGLYLMADGSER